jgi:hypothetical protein
MSDPERLIYESSNGDAWYLIRMKRTEAVFVRHEPNGPSGGKAKLIPVGEFLAQGKGPEHQELLRLVGTLVDQIPPEDESKIAQVLG